MIEKIIIAGAGGQGIMLLGKVLAEAAMRENKHITWLPAYGAEVRGGTAYCMVIISDNQIGAPYIDRADTLIIMNEPSLHKFLPRMKKNGLLIVNSSLVQKVPKGSNIFAAAFTDTAVELGNLKVANMVALGFYINRKKILRSESLSRALKEIAPAEKKDLVGVNLRALSNGMEMSKNDG
jgi:2-oxoglutarate ferredoxin oxidoreductase subunit gamma